MSEELELPLRDICEELKTLNKRMEVHNQILNNTNVQLVDIVVCLELLRPNKS